MLSISVRNCILRCLLYWCAYVVLCINHIKIQKKASSSQYYLEIQICKLPLDLMITGTRHGFLSRVTLFSIKSISSQKMTAGCMQRAIPKSVLTTFSESATYSHRLNQKNEKLEKKHTSNSTSVS